jgi:hypothetical protein
MFDDILKQLIQNELLSEETKAELSEQWNTTVETYKTQVREEVSGEVRAELAAQWIAERDALISKVDDFVAEALTKEIEEFRGDVDRFRDLEAEAAAKLIEAKHQMAREVAEELDDLVDKIDAFFEMRISAELEEMKEDIEVVKQNDFGRKIFDAYASTYASNYVDEDSVQSKLIATEGKLQDVEQQLATLEEERNQMVREAKMEQVLSALTGKKREQMAMVLKNVDTARLEESYKFFIGRVLKEEQEPKPALTEGTKPEQTTLKTGDGPAEVEPKPVNTVLVEMKRLAGIK